MSDTDHPTGYEYFARRPGMFGEQTFDTRHEAVGHAAIASRYTDDEFEVDARRKTKEPMVNDALWRAQIVDEDLETVGWTLLYETRSFAADAAYRYILANHLDMVRVSTMPWYGEDYQQVGSYCIREDSFPIYIGYDSDGEALEHGANALQYAGHWNQEGYEKLDGERE